LSDLQNSVSLVLKNAVRLLTPEFGVLIASVDTILPLLKLQRLIVKCLSKG